MIKKILLVFSVVCLATVTAINTQFTLKSNLPFLLDQIEALASGETLPGVDVTCIEKVGENVTEQKDLAHSIFAANGMVVLS